MSGPGLALLGAEEEAEVLDALRSRRLSRYRFGEDGQEETTPSKVYRFEREFEALTGASHALGTNSCTSALLSGLLAAGIGPGDEVILPGYTFIAPIAAVAYTGATPVLAEVDDALLLDPADVQRRITPRTAALVAVHMLGAPCDLDALGELARSHGLHLIEDCAQAGGGSYHGRHLGTTGLFGAFSLNVFKTFTAGDGGVLVTNDDGLHETAFAVHDHGCAPFRHGVVDGPPLFGLNLRMHELTGAVALAQLRKLPGSLAALRARKVALAGAIGELPGAKQRATHDSAGECATVLAYTFDTAELSAGVARRLGTITLAQSGKHNYAYMPQLRPGGPAATAADRARPMVDRARPALSWPAGSLPRTDDLLARTVALSVGVTDSYLGTSFGIAPGDGPADIDRVAGVFRSAVIEACAEVG